MVEFITYVTLNHKTSQGSIFEIEIVKSGNWWKNQLESCPSEALWQAKKQSMWRPPKYFNLWTYALNSRSQTKQTLRSCYAVTHL